MEKEIRYWQPRVMRHRIQNGYEFAIHEVYFNEGGKVVTYTSDSLSQRESSVENLRSRLLELLKGDKSELEMGDAQYSYSEEDIKDWLNFIDEPPIDYG